MVPTQKERATALGVQERGNQYQSGNVTNVTIAPSQEGHAESLGVRKREDSLKQNSTDPSNDGTVPSAKEHADALGVGRATVERWEADRKEIKADSALSQKSKTPEGYQEAKAEVRKRRNVVVPAYRVDDATGAIKGIAGLVERQRLGVCLKPPSNVRGT